MTDRTDDTGTGPHKPGEGPRRPRATIDLKATEVGGQERAGPGKEDARAGLPPPSGSADRLAAARRWSRAALQSNTFLSHMAAGVAGAVLTLAVGALAGLFSGESSTAQSVSPDLTRRLAAVEQSTRQLAAAPGDAGAKLAKTEERVKALEERTAAIGAVGDAQAKLAAQVKALENRAGSPELAGKVAKLETAVAALAAAGKSGQGGDADALAGRFAELEKLAVEAGETAKGVAQRLDRDLASLKTASARLEQRLDSLKTEVEAQLKKTASTAELSPVVDKLAAFEKDLQSFLRGEADRSANASRVLLTLEIANLKRAMERGDRYTAELEAVKKASGGTLKLAALERHKLEGVPTLPELARDFRRVANAAIDAEAEPADASVLDRLIAGAKGIVRVRKAGHDPQDMSVEAITGRMEAALKEGRLGEVLAQGKTLPPKAALAAEDWLRKVEARHAVDQAMAEIEAGLKSSLAPQPPRTAPEPKR